MTSVFTIWLALLCLALPGPVFSQDLVPEKKTVPVPVLPGPIDTSPNAPDPDPDLNLDLNIDSTLDPALNLDLDLDTQLPGTQPAAPDADPGARPSLARQFMAASTFFLGFRSAVNTANDAKLVNNHIYLRHTAESLFAENGFFRLDWRARAFPKSDHRADAREKTIHTDAYLREGYLLFGHDRFSVRLGSQIHVWGKADTAAVTDVLCPRDTSEFVFFKLEDARFGQFMASADIYMDQSDLFIFIAPKPATDRVPGFGTHYYRPVAGPGRITETEPKAGDIEAGVKLDLTLPKTEISVMAGRFFANAPVYSTGPPLTPGAAQTLEMVYPDYWMAGSALEHVVDNLLLKLELAFKKDVPLQGLDRNLGYYEASADRLDSAAGIEYNANDRWLASLELSNRRRFSSCTGIAGNRKDDTSLYLTYTRDFWHDTLELEYNFYYHLQDHGRFHNIQFTWDLTDTIEITARYTLFSITDRKSALWPYRDEDRAAFELRYAF